MVRPPSLVAFWMGNPQGQSAVGVTKEISDGFPSLSLNLRKMCITHFFLSLSGFTGKIIYDYHYHYCYYYHYYYC